MNHIHHPSAVEAINAAPYNYGVDGATWLASEGNIALSFDNGDVAIFQDEGDATYQAHWLFRSRGRAAVDQAREAFKIMFEQHNAELIFGIIPDDRRDAKLMTRWAGAKSAGKRNTPEGVGELFVLSNQMYYRSKD